MRILVVDAFADRPFTGNPAAVCLVDGDWPAEEWMRRLAGELNMWFLPTGSEERLCGHATLAAAHALHTTVASSADSYRFHTLGGTLNARIRPGRITLDFPVAQVAPCTEPPGLVDALGEKPDATYSTGALGDVLAVFDDEAAVRLMAPDFGALETVVESGDLRGVIVTAPPAPGASYDFISRFFAPDLLEDQVTGSAHTALSPYWSRRLGRAELTGFQASQRTGVVGTALHGDRVHLIGRAVTVLDGTFLG